MALGPGLATVLGQMGGAWGGRRSYMSTEQFYGLTTAATSDIIAHRNGEKPPQHPDTSLANASDHRIRFGLRHMMWLIAWISLLLCLIRLSGIPFEYVLPLIAGWIVYQWITLRVGERLIKLVGPKWVAWRSLRST